MANIWVQTLKIAKNRVFLRLRFVKYCKKLLHKVGENALKVIPECPSPAQSINLTPEMMSKVL